MTDTGPLFVTSGDLLADRRYKAAIELASRGDFSAAADVLSQTVELTPTFATARERAGRRWPSCCGRATPGPALRLSTSR
ncbi:MAG: hypothetical protein WBE64_19610 [Xanthobacteraceae bacterium]